MEFVVNTRNKKTIDVLRRNETELVTIATYYVKTNKMVYYDALNNPLLHPEVMEFIKEKIGKDGNEDELS